MVLRPEPLFAAVEAIKGQDQVATILLSPQGRLFHQEVAAELATYAQLILICGRYEGVDERVREHLVSDEISIGDKTEVAELKDGQIRRYAIRPEEFGMERKPISEIKADDAAHSLETILSVLEDHPGPARDIVVLNAGAAIYTAGLVENLQAGVAKADEAIASGEARNRLDRLVIMSQSFD